MRCRKNGWQSGERDGASGVWCGMCRREIADQPAWKHKMKGGVDGQAEN
jgi:hypothetical protein